jgi:hypothetical protein
VQNVDFDSANNAEHSTLHKMSNKSDKLCKDNDNATKSLQITQDHKQSNKHKRTTKIPKTRSDYFLWTEHTIIEESMSTPKNSLVLVHQNIRGIINKIEELQEYFSNDKIYPHILCFSEHYMSRDDVCFVGIENYVLGSSFSRSTFQKGGVCICIRNDVIF